MDNLYFPEQSSDPQRKTTEFNQIEFRQSVWSAASINNKSYNSSQREPSNSDIKKKSDAWDEPTEVKSSGNRYLNRKILVLLVINTFIIAENHAYHHIANQF